MSGSTVQHSMHQHHRGMEAIRILQIHSRENLILDVELKSNTSPHSLSLPSQP